ncbi:annexin B9-like [Onthophagus taurus]|uniref:annexin B9-like n=1 Tax=Onthophagus taurus TaxID=166361 RepID=UPI0039BE66DD
MSYPGYPYGSGDNSAPYPGGPPYPSPHPPMPGQNYAPPPHGDYRQPVFPPSMGFNVNSPMYMPPQGGYPPMGGNYPPPMGYPHQPPPSGYPYPGGAPPPTSYPYPQDSQVVPETTDINYSSPPRSPQPEIQVTPTLFPADPFDSSADAEVLRKAMKGFGTDEKAIINVLARRTNDQRMEIAVQFKTMYGKDLVKDLRSETSGNFKKLLTSMMTPIPILYAQHIRDAITGIGTDEEVLIEVMCTKSNEEIRCIRSAYETEYGNCLEDDLRSDTSGTFKRIMVSLSAAGRDESMHVDHEAAVQDANRLLEAGENQWGTDESTFNMILCQRNYAQLRVIFSEYEKISGIDIEDTIKSEFSGDAENAFLAIVRSIRNIPHFYAKTLHDAISGIGTKDNKLMRVVATRCEIDMEDIKGIYEAKYGESLAEAIKGDTSGDYKKCLLALIGEY